eukprot:gene12900-15153_t
MAFKLNVSKYRHINGKVDKRELWYPDINTSGSSASSTFIQANARYIAINWQSGTGTVGIVPLKHAGKRKGEVTTIPAHSAPLTDFAFSPFDDSIIATASEDATVRVWSIPSSTMSSKSVVDAVCVLQHQKNVDVIAFNPVASGILATGSADKTVRVWNIENGGSQLHEITVDGAVTGISWNHNGSLLAVVSKDNKIRVIDPRSGQVTAVGDGHLGVKPARAIWLGNTHYIATTGFSKMRERQLSLWDSRDLGRAVKTTVLDSSTGIINPVYDADAALLYLSGSGDSAVRCFDCNTQFTAEPAMNEISAVGSDVPTKGLCAIPKRALDVMEVEIDRLLKLTANNIIPITYTLSRKSKSSFADELFPHTPSTTAALSSAEWIAGETNEPILMSLDPACRPRSADDEEPEQVKEVVDTFQYNFSFGAATTADDTPVEEVASTQHHSTPDVASTPAAEPEVVVARQLNVPKIVRTSKYRHIAGTPVPKVQHYTNLKINGSTSNTSIAVNDEYFAVPWVGTGGPLAVIPISQVGRALTVPCIETGSQLLDFDLSQFHNSLVVTGTEDSHIKLWRMPEGGLPKGGKNLTTFEADFIGHNRKIVSVNFHPTADNVLISTGGDAVVKIWDLEHQKERFSFAGHHTDLISSLSINYTGEQFLTSCKDKKMRIFDPRGNTIISETISHTGTKGAKALWLGDKPAIFSVGFNKSSEREWQLYDSRNLEAGPRATGVFDHLSGVITPYYDEDTGVIFLAGKGDGSIRMMEINDEEPYVHFLTEYSSGTPQIGIAPVSKHKLNVGKCEIARFFKVSDSTVEPLQMNVPRTRTEFFQDDIFVPTRVRTPSMTASEWFDDSACVAPELVSICPSTMTPLSQAPPPPKKEREIIREQEVDTGPSRNDVITSFLDRVTRQEYEEPVKKDTDEACVSDSEWD